MKFSIGTKISLLTSTLVLATAFPLAWWVLRNSIDHVIEHEAVDLADETGWSAQTMLRAADVMRNQVDDLGEQIASDAATALGAHDQPDAGTRQALSDRIGGWMTSDAIATRREFRVLQVELFARREDGTPATVIRRRAEGVADDVRATGEPAFLEEMADCAPGTARLSEFGQAQVKFQRAAGGDDQRVDGRKLVVQAACVIAGSDGRSKGVLLVTSHFRMLDSDFSDEGQTATSPRHFQFLANAQGQFLQHPDPRFIYDLAKGNGPTIVDAEPALRAQFAALDRLMKIPDPRESERAEQEYGQTDKRVALRGLQSWFGLTSVLDERVWSFCNPLPDDPDREKKLAVRQALHDELLAFVRERQREGLEYRFSLPSQSIPRFKIRCLSPEKTDLLPLQTKIDDLLRARGIAEANLRWTTPIELTEFALHRLRLRYEPGYRRSAEDRQGRYLDLLVGASRQEIAADVQSETSWIWRSVVGLGAGAGLLAFLFSRIITRPLNKIIASTEELAQGRFDLELPVKDRGEVGVLARSFSDMVQQLRERGRAVEEEQAKTRGLNEDLKRERDLLDERVRERTRELETANKDLETARVVAEEANRAKSEFLAQMSHELRTPLNAIIGFGELLLEEAAEEQATRFVPDLKKIINAGRHLLGLINDILDLSKIEAGKMELSIEAFEVKPLFESVVSTVEPLIRKNGNRLRWSCDDDVPLLHADRTRVRQVLLNLLSNASKFTKNGEIHLTAEGEVGESETAVVFHVRDTGVGMSADQIGKIFRPFVQVDSSTARKYGGTGLGLAICKRFCDMMGGDISVSSEPGRGSDFTVRLPVAPVVQTAAESPQPRRSASWQGAFVGAVVVIDDDPAARELLERQIGREGFAVFSAAGGEEGLRLVREKQPAFVTLDVKMPGMDGWEVLSILKSDPELCEIPVIMMSMVDDKNLGFALGATDFLAKPVDKNRLLALVQKYRNTGADNQSILVVEDDGATRALLVRILEGAGWSVREAVNGRIALEMLDESRPSLIVLDLMMPEMDGFTFLHEFRSRPEGKQVPIVVVTAKELTPRDRSLLDSGVQKILQKGSYSRDQLLDEVRSLLRPRSDSKQVPTGQVT